MAYPEVVAPIAPPWRATISPKARAESEPAARVGELRVLVRIGSRRAFGVADVDAHRTRRSARPRRHPPARPRERDHARHDAPESLRQSLRVAPNHGVDAGGHLERDPFLHRPRRRPLDLRSDERPDGYGLDLQPYGTGRQARELE